MARTSTGTLSSGAMRGGRRLLTNACARSSKILRSCSRRRVRAVRTLRRAARARRRPRVRIRLRARRYLQPIDRPVTIRFQAGTSGRAGSVAELRRPVSGLRALPATPPAPAPRWRSEQCQSMTIGGSDWPMITDATIRARVARSVRSLTRLTVASCGGSLVRHSSSVIRSRPSTIGTRRRFPFFCGPPTRLAERCCGRSASNEILDQLPCCGVVVLYRRLFMK